MTRAKSSVSAEAKQALVHEMLERVAEKWTLLVIDALDSRQALRFSRLRERLGGVSQKMLTKTLRQLERDGLVVRRVYAEVPPRVDYRLTPLGVSLGESVCGLWTWVEPTCGTSNALVAATTRLPHPDRATRMRYVASEF
ncbi:MAG: winged helix-turn-helix transcriptional regulator [Vicinamibacterales bacterium]